MLGEKLKQLRLKKGLLQKEVAQHLRVDITYVSKIETNKKQVSRGHLRKLATMYSCSAEHLTTLWLADKIYDLTKTESVGNNAIELAQKELRFSNNQKILK